MLHVTCYMSHMLHVTNIKLQTILPMTQCMESLYKIQFNGHDKNVACHMCYMSHVTHVTCHKYQLTKILLKTQCVIYFWKAHAKYSSMVMIKMLHVTYFTCHMSHMLHVTNLKLQTILPMTQCVIYFWKAYTKYSSMVMIKNVACDMC